MKQFEHQDQKEMKDSAAYGSEYKYSQYLKSRMQFCYLKALRL